MVKRNRLTKNQESLKQRVLDAYSKSYGFLYVHPAWETKLWKKSTADICEFLEGRFRETLDVVEYYSAMVLLWKTLPNSELLVEFHQSPQWAEVADTYRTCDHTGKNETLVRNKQNTTEQNIQPIETVKSVGTIRVIGDE
jgi:hypothetical protein